MSRVKEVVGALARIAEDGSCYGARDDNVSAAPWTMDGQDVTCRSMGGQVGMSNAGL